MSVLYIELPLTNVLVLRVTNMVFETILTFWKKSFLRMPIKVVICFEANLYFVQNIFSSVRTVKLPTCMKHIFSISTKGFFFCPYIYVKTSFTYPKWLNYSSSSKLFSCMVYVHATTVSSTVRNSLSASRTIIPYE